MSIPDGKTYHRFSEKYYLMILLFENWGLSIFWKSTTEVLTSVNTVGKLFEIQKLIIAIYMTDILAKIINATFKDAI